MKNLLYICLALLALTPAVLFGQVPHFPIVTGDSTGIGITYRDFDPDIEISYEQNPSDTIWMDLDLDSIPDIYAFREYFNAYYTYRQRLKIVPLPGTEVFCYVDTTYYYPQNYPVPTAVGFTVDSTVSWSDSTSFLYAIYGAAPNTWFEHLFWVQKWNRFLTFRITKPTGVYYGWMRIVVREGDSFADYPTFFQSWAITNGQTVDQTEPVQYLNGISCGPLPTDGILHLNRKSVSLPAVQFTLVDANGRKVKEWQMGPGQQSMSVDISETSPSLYFLRGVSGNENRTWKVLKSGH